jgi:hypothetical protein
MLSTDWLNSHGTSKPAFIRRIILRPAPNERASVDIGSYP